jgi:hypothetical protein
MTECEEDEAEKRGLCVMVVLLLLVVMVVAAVVVVVLVVLVAVAVAVQQVPLPTQRAKGRAGRAYLSGLQHTPVDTSKERVGLDVSSTPSTQTTLRRPV